MLHVYSLTIHVQTVLKCPSYVSNILFFLPQVGYPLCHSCDARNDVAMGDHDTLWYARGATGVHDDCNV